MTPGPGTSAPASAEEAERDAADLGEKAVGQANQPGNATDEAESRVQEAVEAAHEMADEPGGMGRPGRKVNRRSPFWIGMSGAFGVAVTVGLVELFLRSKGVLIVVGLALFIAVGLDPVVSWLTRRGWPRWAAVVVVLLAVAVGDRTFPVRGDSAARPPRRRRWPTRCRAYIKDLQNHNSELGKLNDKYKIQSKLTSLLTSKGSSLAGGVLGAGELVLGTVLGAAGGDRADCLLPGRPAQYQAVLLPAGPALAPPAGHPDHRPDHGQGRRVRAG